MEPYLPHDVLYRKKMGFSVPLAAWFRGPLAPPPRRGAGRAAGSTPACSIRHYLRHLVEAHQSGAATTVLLWTVLMFDAFLRVSAGS